VRILVLKLAQAKYVMTAFNSKGRHEIFVIVVNVLQNTQDFVISRCSFAEDGKTTLYLIKPIVW